MAETFARGPEIGDKQRETFAMIRKVLFLLAVGMLAIHLAQPQSQAADSVKEVKAGEALLLGDILLVKVTQSNKSAFPGIKIKGEPLIVVLELDAGKKGVTLSYNLSADPKSSELYLTSGTQRSAPRAVIEDFPSWGSDNDKEVELLDPKGAGSSSLEFEGKGSISLLFDVPVAQAKGPKKLSMVLRTVQPKREQLSIVVNL
jgi:hypothetical protein